MPDKKSQIRLAFSELQDALTTLLPAGREAALVKTKLEEAYLWACAAAFVVPLPDTGGSMGRLRALLDELAAPVGTPR